MKASSKILASTVGLFALAAVGQIAAHEFISPLEKVTHSFADVNGHDRTYSFYDDGIWSARATETYTDAETGNACTQTAEYKHIFGIPAYTAASFKCE